MTIKNLLDKVQIKCIHCKKTYDYEHIDEHELNCGKCKVCSVKLSPTVSIIQHNINECAKVEFRCVLCMQSFKRDKFRNHKCERINAQERAMIKKALQLNKLDESGVDKSPLLGALKHGSLVDKPRDLGQYEKLWQKKTKGAYLCGLGRWCKVVKHNLDKDPENGSKLFQIIMMVFFGLASIGLTFLLDYYTYKEIGLKKYWLHAIGFGIEIVVGFFMSLIGYFILAKSWEGYFSHRFLQFIHFFTILIVSTVIPHGDFFLHLGYMHKGTNKRGIEEPFPDGLEIPKDQMDYQGYLITPTRGGHFYFLTFGYVKCFLIFIRMSLVLLAYFLEGTG